MKKNLVPFGSEYLFAITWICLESAGGPQKNYIHETSNEVRAKMQRPIFTHHSNVRLRMLITNAAKDVIPIGPAKVSGCTKRGNGVLLSTDIVDL